MSGTNKKWKDSTDLTLMDGDDFAYRHFIKHLDSVLDKCIMNYYDCFNISGKQKIDDHYSAEELYATNSLYTRMDNYLMKRYKAPKQGYNGWHCDWSRQELAINRQLIVMFYLNDVKKGGETEFYYQKIK